MNSNPEYRYCMLEMIIDSNLLDNIRFDPKWKLLQILGFSAYSLHEHNQKRKTQQREKYEQFQQKLNSNFDMSKFMNKGFNDL